MVKSVIASETDMVTMALKRIDAQSSEDNLLDSLKKANVHRVNNSFKNVQDCKCIRSHCASCIMDTIRQM